MKLIETDRFPKMFSLKRHFPDKAIADVEKETAQRMAQSGLAAKIEPKMKIAITAGSRGIDRIAGVLKAVGEVVRSRGATPFIVPAMGSHGGASAKGQTEALDHLGINEKTTGMTIVSDMATVEIGSTGGGAKIFVDKAAMSADGIVAINRIKPHTSFSGEYGSGLCKMLVVGLGKQDGAKSFHQLGPLDQERLLTDMARLVIEKAPVLGGIGLVEDCRDKLCTIEACVADKILDVDKKLLNESRRNMPRLPFDDIDVLAIGEIGKDISGTGMDPNVTGRLGIRLMPDHAVPKIRRIVVLDLTEKTAGNANGIGMADITTKRVVSKIDWESTVENVLTSSFPEKAALPIHFASDREAIAAALMTCYISDTRNAKMLIVKNTLELEEIMFSEALLHEARKIEGGQITEKPGVLDFDNQGNLISGWGKSVR